MMHFYQDEQDQEEINKWLNSNREAKDERDAKIMFYLVAFGLVSVCCGMFYMILR